MIQVFTAEILRIIFKASREEIVGADGAKLEEVLSISNSAQNPINQLP